MRSKVFFKLTALLATFLTTEIYAAGVVVEAEDQSYLFEVNENDRFCDIMNAIDMALYGQPYHHSSMEKIIQIKMSPQKYSKGLQTTNASVEMIRDYSAGITEEEANEIVYIIKTMANSNLIKLKSAESSLKKAGDRIDHIHPLYFLSTIFCNEELTVCVRNIKGRLFVWKGFLNGAVNTLIEEDKKIMSPPT